MKAQGMDSVTGQSPLKGVVLCCTSLEQDVRVSELHCKRDDGRGEANSYVPTRLVDAATQMGAVHKLDLTTDVTHLIVGSAATPKYKYVAKERPDIKVLHMNWIEAVREMWMEGGDVDVAALEREHHFLPFTGLQLCLTGFDDLEQRNYISSTVKQQGGTYDGTMTKATTTHLIAAVPQGQKYVHAKMWGIPVVSLKWFEDSIRRGMSVDESLYDPALPLEQQGRGAFRRHALSRTSLGKHERESTRQSVGSIDPDRKRLRRTASTRLEGQSQDMWSDMSAVNTSRGPSAANQWKDDDDRTTHVSESTLKTSPRTKSSGLRKADGVVLETGQEPDGLLVGQCVLVHGFDQSKTALLESVLKQNGASVVHSAPELGASSHHVSVKARCLLVPHTASRKSLDLPQVPAGTTTVSEWWLERCIHHKQLLDPEEDVLSRPLWDEEILGFSELVISTTGLGGVDLRQVAQAVKLIGGTYQETILPSISVLISGSASIRKEKAFYANKHNIPVVSTGWLWSCLKSRKREPLSQFKIELSAFDLRDLTGEPSTSSPAPSISLDAQASSASKTKDDAPTKRLSNVRKKHATPLPLHAAKSEPQAAVRKVQSIQYDSNNDDDQSPLDSDPVRTSRLSAPIHKDSHPLQDLSPNLSPRKRPGASDGAVKTTPAHLADDSGPSSTLSPRDPALPAKPSHEEPQTHDVQVQPASRSQHEMNADLAELLHRQIASRPNSAAPAEPPSKRKNRPLGRAASGISHRSISASTSAHSDSLSTPLPSDLLEAARDERGRPIDPLPPPSTQLGYETAEAEAHRLQMSKRMGAKLQDDGAMKRVASLGMVKDTTLAADAGVSNRVKGRQRPR